MQTSSPSPPLETTKDLAAALAESYPPLASYWPHLSEVSLPQALFLFDQSREIFYGGAAGGGKSDALLAAALQYADVPGYAALILRRTFTDLSLPGAVMARAQEWLAGKAHWSHERKTWTFPSGASLSFAYMASDADMARYQSAEFQYVAYDEVTQFTETQYEWLYSRQRATSAVDVPLRMRAASNPGGIGHGWVKRRFVNPASRRKGAVFVPAKLADHPDKGFREGYHDSLSYLDDLTRRRLENGDWDVAEGLAFEVNAAHLVANVEIPDGWHRFESMDFGVTAPTVVLAWAVDYDGNALIFDEYVQGKTGIADHADAIKKRRKTWWPEGSRPVSYADPSMWAKTGSTTKWGEPATEETEFREQGITGLQPANNKRRPGLLRLRELLREDQARLFPAWHHRAEEPGSPRMFIVADRCPILVEQLQAAPLNEKPVDGHGPGEVVDPETESADLHAVAAARYGGMSRPKPSDKPEEVPDDPRAAFLQRVEKQRDTPATPRYERV